MIALSLPASVVVAVWTKIPVNKLTESEAGRLAKLEQILHKRVIGGSPCAVSGGL